MQSFREAHNEAISEADRQVQDDVRRAADSAQLALIAALMRAETDTCQALDYCMCLFSETKRQAPGRARFRDIAWQPTLEQDPESLSQVWQSASTRLGETGRTYSRTHRCGRTIQRRC